MSVLNLDAPAEVEKPCYLCVTTNYDYLLQLRDQLSDSSGNQNMYTIMYEAFKRRTNQALNKEHKDIAFAQFKLHFEEHLLSLRACITRDIREVKKMQARLLKDIYGKDSPCIRDPNKSESHGNEHREEKLYLVLCPKKQKVCI